MVDYTRAIKRPFGDFERLALGIVLEVIPIINFIAMGYQLECAKTAMKKNFKLPEWKNFGDYFVQGLVMTLIVLAYVLIPVILMAISGVGIAPSFMKGNFAALGGAGIGFIASLLLLIVALYIIPVALMNYVKSGKIDSAFSFSEVLRKAFTGKYFVAWLVASIYGFILMVPLSFIPFIGWAIAGFIAGVTSMTIFGEVYTEIK